MLAIKELPSLFIQYDKQSQTHNDEPKIVTRYDIKKNVKLTLYSSSQDLGPVVNIRVKKEQMVYNM